MLDAKYRMEQDHATWVMFMFFFRMVGYFAHCKKMWQMMGIYMFFLSKGMITWVVRQTLLNKVSHGTKASYSQTNVLI